MLLVLPKLLSSSNCILILVMSNLAMSAPLKSRKRSPNEQGFSASPRILEIQLPLKITSKEDLIAWSKYVMGLMASKINSKNGPPIEKRVSLVDNSKTKEMMKKASLSEKRQGLNYPARRLKEPPMQRGDEKVVAYPLPVGGINVATPNPQDPSSLSTSNIDGSIDFGQFANFNVGNPFHQSEFDTFENFDLLMQPPYRPAPPATYLPLPLRTTNVATIDKNVSGFEEPARLQTVEKSLNHRMKDIDNELGQALTAITVNDRLTEKNLSLGEPLLTFPFQAVITITRQLPAATSSSKTQPKDYFRNHARDPINEFPPYFENNYTITNESGQINVVLNDLTTNGTKIEENVQEKKEKKEERQEMRGQKKKSEKTTKNVKKQKSRKRQSSVLGDLLRMLGILRKLPKNATEVNVAPPVLSILKGGTQKIQVAFEDETVPNRGRRNETFQAQQLNGDDEQDDNEQNDDEEQEQEQQQDDDDDDEEEGGSIQAIIDLLPLAAPILEDLSDPESDVDIVELLQSAIPLLEGLSDPEDDGIDIPGVLVPLSQRLSEGPEGEGSDSGAILGPLIQLIAPLIGPLVGPLIGPLSRTSSGPNGKEGSASALAALSGPLSEPQGAYGQSILSGLIASITARLSKELAASAGDSDVKSLVSSIVSGVLAGTSAGSSGQKGHQSYGHQSYGHQSYGHQSYGQKDTYHSQTTYDGYQTYDSYKPTTAAPSAKDMIAASLQEVLGAFLKLSATSSTSSANLSGTSSSSSTGLSASSSQSSNEEPPKPAYGQGMHYGYPQRPPSTSYSRRQKRHQIKRF